MRAQPLPTDEELIALYRQGDGKAFPALFTRYKGKVYFLVQRYFPNRERAEEVFQEVFLKVIEKIDSFDAAGSFRSWFLTICRNHCIDRLRQQSRRPEIPESSLGSDDSDHPPPSATAVSKEVPGDDALYSSELGKQLQRALDKLPEEQRDTFLLKERMGMTFEEIAERTQVSVNTVKSRMRYALEALRRTLRGKDFVKEAIH